MIPTMTELTDKELDAVSGGSIITLAALNQQNFATMVGTAVNAAAANVGSAATVVQTAVQSNSIS